ncbi:hypothetical protein B4144_1484 [Bacillus atrophaeus]|nr:hypothetical protein B4144_1484 [Bacillus atrophaeus]
MRFLFISAGFFQKKDAFCLLSIDFQSVHGTIVKDFLKEGCK